MFSRLYPLVQPQGRSQHMLRTPWICALGTHQCWVGRGFKEDSNIAQSFCTHGRHGANRAQDPWIMNQKTQTLGYLRSVSLCICWSWEDWLPPCGQSRCHGPTRRWTAVCRHTSFSGTHPTSCLLHENTEESLNNSEWMNGVLGNDSALLRLYWAEDNLGQWDEFCYESCPWCRIDSLAC